MVGVADLRRLSGIAGRRGGARRLRRARGDPFGDRRTQDGGGGFFARFCRIGSRGRGRPSGARHGRQRTRNGRAHGGHDSRDGGLPGQIAGQLRCHDGQGRGDEAPPRHALYP